MQRPGITTRLALRGALKYNSDLGFCCVVWSLSCRLDPLICLVKVLEVKSPAALHDPRPAVGIAE